MESYDVIIIGAGPGGLNCAKELGRSKLKVLILEKNAKVGPKVCAGGLTGKDIDYLKLPNEIREFSFEKIKLHLNEEEFDIKNNYCFAYTIERTNFGQWQLKKLKAFKNIEVRTNACVSKINKNYVIVNNKKIKFKYLIGADGSSSLVRRFLKLNTNDLDMGMQYIIPTKKYKDFEIFFEPEKFGPWYAWIFPHKNYVSIGCGANPKIIPAKKLKQNFHVWLKEKKINFSKGKFEAFPINYDYKGYKFGNIFLIGDAAGLASGLTGEGIYQALISGQEVGKMILNKNYHAKKMEELLKLKQKHKKLLKISIRFKYFRLIIFFIIIKMFKSKYFQNKITKLVI